jgi:pyridinium-3,5-biscarboxylic acid mononucleotide synthase
MDPRQLRELLESLEAGRTSVDEAVESLRSLPFRQVGHVATVDHHRHLRLGFPEVIFGEGKTAEQIVAILNELARAPGSTALLATRVDGAKAEAVVPHVPGARYERDARLVVVERGEWVDRGRGTILVVSAGTADLPVAEEAFHTARFMGNQVGRVYDVGVAGVHRTLARVEELRAAEVVIVVAGMEGALPTLVGGLVDRPVIAVPTSVGYGASYGGLAALLGMMTSCAAGVTVVNIDNGFGAAYAAALMNRVR